MALMGEWHWPDLSRDRAVELLAGKPDGTFLVRESSSQKGAYSISVVQSGVCNHVKLLKLGAGFAMHKKDTPSATVSELIASKVGESMVTKVKGSKKNKRTKSALLVAPLNNPAWGGTGRQAGAADGVPVAAGGGGDVASQQQAPQRRTATINKGTGSLGISFRSGADGIVITKVAPGSPAAGILDVFDEIFEISNIAVSSLDKMRVVEIIKASGPNITMVVSARNVAPEHPAEPIKVPPSNTEALSAKTEIAELSDAAVQSNSQEAPVSAAGEVTAAAAADDSATDIAPEAAESLAGSADTVAPGSAPDGLANSGEAERPAVEPAEDSAPESAAESKLVSANESAAPAPEKLSTDTPVTDESVDPAPEASEAVSPDEDAGHPAGAVDPGRTAVPEQASATDGQADQHHMDHVTASEGNQMQLVEEASGAAADAASQPVEGTSSAAADGVAPKQPDGLPESAGNDAAAAASKQSESGGEQRQAPSAVQQMVDRLFRMMKASEFLTGSQLQNVMVKADPPIARAQLGRLWSLVDTAKVGKLDRDGVKVLFGLMAQVQAGADPNPAELGTNPAAPSIAGLEIPAVTASNTDVTPKSGDVRPAAQAPADAGVPKATDANASVDEDAQQHERNPAIVTMSQRLFRMFKQPADGTLSGAQLQKVMVKADPVLDKAVLGKCWAIADTTKAGKLTIGQVETLFGMMGLAQSGRSLSLADLGPNSPVPTIAGL